MAILRTVVKCIGYIAVSRKMHTSNIAYSFHPQGVITFLMQNQRNLVWFLLNRGWKGKGHMLVCNHPSRMP